MEHMCWEQECPSAALSTKNYTGVSWNRNRFSATGTHEWCYKEHLIVIHLFEKLLILESPKFHDCPHRVHQSISPSNLHPQFRYV